MKNLSIALAMLILGTSIMASTAQAGPGDDAGYSVSSSDRGAVLAKLNRAPVREAFTPVIPAAFVGSNDGDVCRNINLTCKGIGHGPIGTFCSGCGFSGWWSAH